MKKKVVFLHCSFLRRRKPALRCALGAYEQGASFTKLHSPGSMPLRVAPFFSTATGIARNRGSTLHKEIVLAQLLQFGSSGWIVAIRFHRGSVVRLLLNVGRMCEIVIRR